jgi:hypothetical protein
MCADEVTRVAFVAAANGVDDAVMLAQAVRSAQRGHRQEVDQFAWLGFPMILICAGFDGLIVYSLGFWRGMLAIALGQAL